MSIYSANRTESMALAQVAANESYASEDLGRIMYETQVNDMAFFEAILACDFNEVKGLREGTILESEITSLNEKASNGIIDGLCNALKLFWGKIKAVYQSSIDKIAAYVLNDGKAFVKAFESKVGKNAASWSGSVNNVTVFNTKHKCLEIPDGATVSKWIETLNSKKSNDSAAEILGWELAARVGSSEPVSAKEYFNKASNVSRFEETLNARKIDEYKKAVSDAKSSIAKLKEDQKKTEKSINETMKKLRNQAKDSESKKSDISRLNSIVTAYQNLVSTVAKVGIQIVRNDLKSRRIALTKAMNDITGSSKTLGEAAILEAAGSFDDAMINDLSINTETRYAIDNLVNSI